MEFSPAQTPEIAETIMGMDTRETRDARSASHSNVQGRYLPETKISIEITNQYQNDASESYMNSTQNKDETPDPTVDSNKAIHKER